MPLFVLPETSRGQVLMACVHVLTLVVALAVAWKHDGPPAEKATYAILAYFVELAACGAVELAVGFLGRSRIAVGNESDQ